MKIAFESQLFLKGNKTGIAWCADNLIKRLVQNPNYECQLNYFLKGYSEDELQCLDEYKAVGAKSNSCKRFNDVWYKLIWPFIPLPYSWFFGSDCDITQFFNYAVPPGVKGKKVTIVYDMAHLACPETVRMKTKKWLDITLKQSCRRADMIVTISEFSKQEIIKFMKIPQEKITVIPMGVNTSLYHMDYSQTQIDEVKEKYAISGEYLLYLGTIEPRKNLQRLIKAYALLREEMEDVPPLIMAGGKGWLYEPIYETVERLQLQESVKFIGYVAQEDAPKLFSGAKAFLFPSIYEGFGMPVLEAMACGTPVLTSNTSSLPEVAGDAALLVNPKSIEDIKQGIKRLVADDNICAELSVSGQEHVKAYTWERPAEILKKAYSKLIETQTGDENGECRK